MTLFQIGKFEVSIYIYSIISAFVMLLLLRGNEMFSYFTGERASLDIDFVFYAFLAMLILSLRVKDTSRLPGKGD